MPRSHKKPDAGFAQRLKIAIRETGMTQEDFAASIETTGHNVSRWVTGAQAPDAPGMAKLARGLKERFIWVLTEESQTGLVQQPVGSLPAQVRETVIRTARLSTDDQETVAVLAQILEERQRNPKLVHALVDHLQGVALAFEEGRQGRYRSPASDVRVSP